MKAACCKWPLRGNQTGKRSQKRALTLTHDRRFNRLRNLSPGRATRAVTPLYGKDTPVDESVSIVQDSSYRPPHQARWLFVTKSLLGGS
jgi:hypothetical protein